MDLVLLKHFFKHTVRKFLGKIGAGLKLECCITLQGVGFASFYFGKLLKLHQVWL